MTTTKTFRMALAVGVLACAIGFAPFPASAQEPSAQQPPQPSANSVAMAKELITMKGGTVMFERIVPGVIESAKNNLVSTNPNLSKDLGEVATLLQKETEPKRAEIITNIATLYAQRFTEQELKDLLAFYKTPLGQKAIDEEPAAIDASMKYAQTWAEDLYQKVVDRFRAEMKTRGHNL